MLLNEIFNTKVAVSWEDNNHQHRGTFVLNNVTYVIKVDEWQFQLPTGGPAIEILDIGFSAAVTGNDQSLNPTSLYTAPSVLGAVLNGIKPQIKRLHPDALLFGARKSDPLVGSRMSTYERIGDMYMKVLYPTKMRLETTLGTFILMSKIQFSKEQQEFIEDFVDKHFNDK